MIRHPQRTQDDCVVCSIATYLNLTYDTVLDAARRTGYEPGSGTGAVPGRVLMELDYDPQFAPRKLVRTPCLVSVDSINFAGQGHLVVYTGYSVIDCSNLRQVDESMLPDIIRYSYWVEQTPTTPA